MPEDSTGLSAVARRRTQKDGPAPQADRKLSVEQETKNSLKRPQSVEINATSTRGKRSKKQRLPTTSVSIRSSSSDDEGAGSTNQFSSLATPGQTADEVGKIEELARGRIKATVGSGKKVFVTGSYWLWIKSGTISIYGAILTASEAVCRVHAPFSHSVPTIEVLSEYAEIELGSLEEGLFSLAKLLNRSYWDAPIGAVSSRGTFFVLGNHFSMQPNLALQYELNISTWRALLAEIGEPRKLRPRILVTGKRSAGVPTLVRCLINRTLSLINDTGKPNGQGVLLIDLDHELPEVSPPGTMSISHIKETLLGPVISHPDPAREIIKLHFIGSIGVPVPGDHLAEIVYDLVHSAKEHAQDVPIIARAPTWMFSSQSDVLRRLCQEIGVTQVIHLDGFSSSTVESFSLEGGITSRKVPSIIVDPRVNRSDEQESKLQSYFHSCERNDGPLRWREGPLTTTSSARHILSFAPLEGNSAVILLLDPLVAIEDTLDAVLGSIGAVLTVPKHHYDQILKDYIWTDQNGLLRLKTPMPYPISPSHSECLGLAYVAEIDGNASQLVVYTPISPAKLQGNGSQVLVLVFPGNRQSGFLGSEWIVAEIENSQS